MSGEGYIQLVVKKVVDFLRNTNMTEPIKKERVPATPEGMLVAYSSLVVMAMVPIIFGSIRSVKLQKSNKASGEKSETMTKSDAMVFPLIASVALFSFYLFFKIFSKDHINLMLSAYFFVLGVIALAHLLSPIVNSLMPALVPKIPFHILFTQGEGRNKKNLINYKFTTFDVVCLVISSVIGVWYLLQKHWIANNLFGLAFAINGVELLHLNNIVTGCILLSGLFFYDIFWVFGTNVMVTVAMNFDAPIKLVFPQDLIKNGINGSNFAMLGLGDIVIPGIFIALLLRYDQSTKSKSRFYFYSTLIAYFMGLMSTILVMHVFKHAQPALLYLVPACMGTPLFLALVRGELKSLFAYEENTEEKNTKKVAKDANSLTSDSSNSSKKKESKKAK